MVGVATVWTPERSALLPELMTPSFDFAAAYERLNALPGPKITSVDAVKVRWYQVARPGASPAGSWSDDRVNLLLALRADGVEWAEIKAAINLLPGQRIPSAQAAMVKYSKIRAAQARAANNSQVQGPANTGHVAAGTSPAARPDSLDVSSLNLPPVPRVPEAFFGPGGELLISYEAARRWAIRNRLCHKANGLDLKAVNAARIAAGFAKFSIQGAL